MLEGRNDVIDYAAVIKKYPWIVERDQDCILSPDSDGLLCGLFMSHHLNWKVRGFYDGKILVLQKGFKARDCVFLDMEIFRKEIKSVGQHMVMYNHRRLPPNWNNFDNCISINNLRGHDGYHDFRLKYPFATIHFLVGLIGSIQNIEISKRAIAPILFADGTWMTMVQYTENSLSWLKYLRAEEKGTALNKIFLNKHYSVHELMLAMNDFLRARDAISIPRERGDRVTITLRGGEGTPHNLVLEEENFYLLNQDAKKRAERFLALLSKLTGWSYNIANWSWNKWQLSQFTKGDFTGTSLSNRSFDAFIAKNPLSFAMTGSQNIEFTIEHPDELS